MKIKEKIITFLQENKDSFYTKEFLNQFLDILKIEPNNKFFRVKCNDEKFSANFYDAIFSRKFYTTAFSTIQIFKPLKGKLDLDISFIFVHKTQQSYNFEIVIHEKEFIDLDIPNAFKFGSCDSPVKNFKEIREVVYGKEYFSVDQNKFKASRTDILKPYIIIYFNKDKETSLICYTGIASEEEGVQDVRVEKVHDIFPLYFVLDLNNNIIKLGHTNSKKAQFYRDNDIKDHRLIDDSLKNLYDLNFRT